MIRLMRSVSAAAAFASKPENWDICCERLAAPDRVGAARPHQTCVERFDQSQP